LCLEKIDPAIASVRNDLITSSQLTQTYGLSFVVGGMQNILGDFLGMVTHIFGDKELFGLKKLDI
jgi:hypothetical protein